MYVRGVTPEDAADRAQALLEHARFEHMGQAMTDELPFRVVNSNSYDGKVYPCSR
jgi:hypothetical protein